MTLFTIFFYILAVLILVSTGLAVTRRNMVHSVVYLVFSFFGTALLFYLFGAPFLAALEVIIYAGAIMVLFLFIVMMLRADAPREHLFPVRQWIPAASIGVIYLGVGLLIVLNDPDTQAVLKPATASPRAFGAYVFQRHWLAVEIVSMILLVVLVGALHLGKASEKVRKEEKS
jgi:NADH-quinone oxidoreductase subunit J